jgi:hypothetical protein
MGTGLNGAQISVSLGYRETYCSAPAQRGSGRF